MPLAQIYLWKGISEEIIKKVIVGVTEVFVDLGIPKQAVEVLVHEIPKAHWGIDGLPANESRPEAKPPQ
ncbi:MAG: tautomerase family protein [Candidatus Lokiarchaeota archaeon]|nr:tautomerase family protein [Candidatus Lokiarchaeota archaeon]